MLLLLIALIKKAETRTEGERGANGDLKKKICLHNETFSIKFPELINLTDLDLLSPLSSR